MTAEPSRDRTNIAGNDQQIPVENTPPAFQIPDLPNTLFVGRDAQLAALEQLLTETTLTVLTMALVGMSGIGKTMLAATFAWHQRTSFPDGVFWLNMQQPELIAGQVAACAGPAGLDLIAYEQLSFEERIAQVKIAWNGPELRLLVFDNLEDATLLKQWLPSGSGSRVLITTHREDWPRQVQRLRMAELPRAQSIELLLGARAAEQDRTVTSMLADRGTATDADAVCELLGDVPLPLALAAAFLHMNPGTTLQHYREQIEAKPTLHETLTDSGLPSGHEHGIIATFAISYQQLQDADPTDVLAQKMLHAASYCAPTPIPQEVLWWVAQPAGRSANAGDASEQRDLAIRRLQATGLITFATQQANDLPQAILLHSLIAKYIRVHQAGENMLESLSTSLTTIGDAIVNRANAQQGRVLIPQLEHVLAQPAMQNEIAIAALLTTLANLYHQQLIHAKALPLYQRALAIREKLLGSKNAATLISLGNLATSYQSIGDHAEALRLYEQLLSMNTKVYGEMHPDTAQSFSNLGRLHQEVGAYQKALPLLQQALTIRKQILETHDPLIACSLNELATVLEHTGDYDTALTLLKVALEIAEHGGNEPIIRLCLNNLARCYRSKGMYREALPLLQQSLERTQQRSGPNHPETLMCLNNLAGIYQHIEAYSEALTIYTRILPLREQVLGSDHPDTSVTLNDLANLYRATAEYARAIPLYERAIDISQRIVGANHPGTATCIYNLAACYAEQADFTRAIPLTKQALKIRERALGIAHPLTVETRKSLLEMQHAPSNQSTSPLGRVLRWLRRNQD
jgi:tetratricopeptide (TPR) repeat protein